MSDDHNQRPYRSHDTVARAPSGKPAATPPGAPPSSGNASDPLAELARLIGQTDPFSEFGGRANTRPTTTPEPAAPEWTPPPSSFGAEPASYEPSAEAPAAPPPEPKFYSTPPFGRQPYGGGQFGAAGDSYPPHDAAPPFAPTQSGYVDDHYDPNGGTLDHDQDDYYDDAPPSRRRLGVMVIAAVFALAVIGTAGAFGYRALFGGSSARLAPPVIKADTAPSKVVPAVNKDASNKLITDRVNDRSSGEQVVSREEKPLDLNSGAPFQAGQDNNASGSANPSMPPPPGSGIVGDPKKVRTIVIRPDQMGTPDPSTPSPPPAPARQAVAAPMPAPSPTPPPPKPVAPQRVQAAPETTPDPAPHPPGPARVAPVARQAAAPAANAPLSLNPDAAPPAKPVRTAAAPAAAAPVQAVSGGAGSYAVQISSQRSEAEAEAAFRALQGKFPGQLGNRQPIIRRVDLGDKGIYFRAMVGPFASGGEAGDMCSSLKAAGGSCLIQKN